MELILELLEVDGRKFLWFIDVVLLPWEVLLWVVLICITGSYYLMGELLILWEELMGEVVLSIVLWDLRWEELRREVLWA